jgi:hypothetical protein
MTAKEFVKLYYPKAYALKCVRSGFNRRLLETSFLKNEGLTTGLLKKLTSRKRSVGTKGI